MVRDAVVLLGAGLRFLVFLLPVLVAPAAAVAQELPVEAVPARAFFHVFASPSAQ